MKDLFNNIGVVTVIPAAEYDDDNTPAAIDLRGFNSAVIALSIGVGGITFTTNNKIEFKLTHSNDDSSYEAVTVADLQGVDEVGTGGIIHALTAAHANPTLTKIGYVGGRRYLKLLADFAGTHGTGTPISAVALLGDATKAPVA